MEWNERNQRSNARLREICSRLGAASSKPTLANGWTTAAVLAHIAFWERFTVSRWRLLTGAGKRPWRMPDFLDLINEVALPEWSALSLSVASRLALEAADAADQVIRAAPRELVEEMRAAGFEGMFERS